jgi:transcription elongation factor GreA
VSDGATTVTWLTREAYDRLSGELEYLSGPARLDIAKKIEAAREEGDLKENGGYHAAKEEQGKQAARIRQLTQLLERAHVGEAPTDSGIALPGMVVTVRFGNDQDTSTFLLGSREDVVDIDVYSPQSPLGAAIAGHRVGGSSSYTLPNGAQMSVTIVAVTPYAG